MGALMKDGVGLTESQLQRAEYIERMSRELSRIASASHLHLVSYLLDMATEEATLLRESGKLKAMPKGPSASREPRALRRS